MEPLQQQQEEVCSRKFFQPVLVDFRVCDLSCTVWTFVDQKDPMSGFDTKSITSHRMEMAEVGCESAVRFVTRL